MYSSSGNPRCLFLCGNRFGEIEHHLLTSGLKLECINYRFVSYKHRFSLHKKLIDRVEWRGLLWCFCQQFGLSFWRHPFTTEDLLVSKCNVKFPQICCDEETILSTSSFVWGRVGFKMSIYGRTIPLIKSSILSNICKFPNVTYVFKHSQAKIAKILIWLS